eukprot:UN26246
MNISDSNEDKMTVFSNFGSDLDPIQVRSTNFFAKKFADRTRIGPGSDPDRIQNFAKKIEPLCEEMRWSRKSRPWGINVKFDSLSYGKTYMIIFQVVLRKKFYCCYFF